MTHFGGMISTLHCAGLGTNRSSEISLTDSPHLFFVRVLSANPFNADGNRPKSWRPPLYVAGRNERDLQENAVLSSRPRDPRAKVYGTEG